MRARLDQMIKGWFVGDFDPVVLRTSAVEVAVKEYSAGEREDRHHHKIATEVTVIVRGRVRMNSQSYSTGDILLIGPSESTDFEALEDTTTVVVKLPSAKADKYPGPAQ